jgi:hypothetical protein
MKQAGNSQNNKEGTIMFTNNKMERGNKVIGDVVAKFQGLVAKIESGIADLQAHEQENNEKIEEMMGENASIIFAIGQAETVKENLKKIFA